MKKRMLALLVCLTLCGTMGVATASEEDATSWPAVIYASMDESDWYGDTTDDERIDMAWELLNIFRYAGYSVGGMTAGDFAQAMNDSFDVDKSRSVWAVATDRMGEDGSAAQRKLDHYNAMGEPDWYGDTTDDERIAMAGDILGVFRVAGYPVGGIEEHVLAQAMNDYYDQDKSQSVFAVAMIALEPLMPAFDELRMPSDYAQEDATKYQQLYEPDWYGDTTDEERIDMAWALLSILRQSGYAIGHTGANDFAQAMNEYYDQDKSLSVWDVALAVL